MLFKHAKKLRKEDEITDKENGAIMRVISTRVIDDGSLKHPSVFIEATDQSGIWQEYLHTEVK